MQETSDLYKSIIAGEHWKETRLGIAPPGYAIHQIKNWYGENVLIRMDTALRVFSKEQPSVGNCVSAEIDVAMLRPDEAIPRQALLVPQIRITDGSRYSEWISKGVFYLDTRSLSGEGTAMETLALHGYDSMLKTEQDYPRSVLEWPARDIDVVREIAEFIQVEIDPRTIAIMTRGYAVQLPSNMTCRETLGYIAAMYGGSFVMSDIGELRLVTLNSIPPESSYLITENYDAITFGGDRIIV